MNWTQISLGKWWNVTERARFQLRLDGNNLPFKQPQYSAPNGTFNANNPGAFARIGNTARGSFSTLGTANSNWQAVGRFEF